jgi:signal transduction histidine kinase
MNWASWRRTLTSSPARWRKPADAPRFYGRHFARAAHPLAVLRGELEAIQDGVRQFTPESVASLQAEVGTLTKLVDDLHQLSMSDEGALAYQKAPVDVINILEVVTGAFRERFASRDLKINLAAGQRGGIWRQRSPDAAVQ